MKNIIVSDSCLDFNDDLLPVEDSLIRVPFNINISGEEIVDKDLDIDELISKMKASKDKITTSCPSPNDYLEAFKKGMNAFAVTISAKLSGSHNSAVIAKRIAEESKDEGEVHVFDCKSAAAGQNLVVLKIKKLLEDKLSFAKIVEEVNRYIEGLKTIFVLDSLDNLIKNGRVSPLTGLIGTALHIVPIMGDDGDGNIVVKERVRGKKRAFDKLIELIGKSNVDFKNTVLAITHINAMEKAIKIKDELQRLYSFKDIHIFKGGGLSTVYGDDGGIIIAY
ncbi:MAG: DegV family protein [Clostridiales bacterium]|nr:DegV family protein [Clostridiales bacterium]